MTFFASLVFLGISDVKGSHTVSLLAWKINGETVGTTLLFTSPVPCFGGFIIGIMTRKASMGKAALIAGGTGLFLWVLLIGAALIAISHKIK